MGLSFNKSQSRVNIFGDKINRELTLKNKLLLQSLGYTLRKKMSEFLSILDDVNFDETVTKFEYHTYLPYSTNTFILKMKSEFQFWVPICSLLLQSHTCTSKAESMGMEP